VIDQDRLAHQPRVAGPGHRVAPLLGAEYQRLLLRAADEQDPLRDAAVGPGGLGQVPLGDVVFPLAFAEVHQVQAMSGDVVVDVRHERLGHRPHEHRGRILVPAVAGEELLHPAAVLQPGLEDVEVETVDALDLEHHVIGQDVGDSAR